MNARQKGAAGEREWAKYLRDTFGLLDARRGVQFAGSFESPDCTGAWAGTHTEVKRVEKFHPYSWIEQAVRDADGKLIPYVAHRQNGKPWLVTVRADDLLQFAIRVSKSFYSTQRSQGVGERNTNVAAFSTCSFNSTQQE